MRSMERIGEAELNAYLDAELDAEGRLAVEAWLIDNPDEANRLEALRGDKDALAGIHADIMDAPVPETMRAAASVVLLLVGAAAGWIAHSTVVRAGLVASCNTRSAPTWSSLHQRAPPCRGS